MRHLCDRYHLNRTASHRKALLANLSSALFTHKQITTTLVKAKYARRFAERMITFARKSGVQARRHVLRFIRDKEVVKKLFDELGPHFKNRNGGYTRIIKLGPRRGDAAPMAILELVGFDDVGSTETKKESKSRLKAKQREVTRTRQEKKPKPDEITAEETVEDVEVAEEHVTENESSEDVSESDGGEVSDNDQPDDDKVK